MAVSPAVADELLVRRLSGEPLAYILGYREFFSRRFSVDPSVLIPRQETETLIAPALRLARPGSRVLDLGTGSGCLAVTLKLERPDLEVCAVDISEAALAVARTNAEQLEANVSFCRSDLFEAVLGTFDVIVSNPPYIAAEAPLPREIREYEPPEALFAGSDGMAIYTRIAASSAPLAGDGHLIVELGDGMGGSVQGVFQANGWRTEEIVRDLGGTPRGLIVRR